MPGVRTTLRETHGVNPEDWGIWAVVKTGLYALKNQGKDPEKMVVSPEGREEVIEAALRGMSGELTGGYFNRDGFLDDLLNHVDANPINIWNPGCASGAESYSIVIALLEKGYAPDDISLLATDAQKGTMEHGPKGRYTSHGYLIGLLRHIYGKTLDKHFEVDGKQVQVKEHAMKPVKFARHNLKADLLDGPAQGIVHEGAPYDLIVCRNTLKYFTQEVVAGITQKFHEVLAPRGVLCIDSANEDKVLQGSKLFTRVAKNTYRRK